ncbi:DUF2975 domain-containing protein [Maribacter sp. PR1]|uniref:DUF2975 domain-containing protein n=1 Tax=Maribacter cobaltidurans TaxID=1178778 RepID=A0ABU7IRD1_9FLAO|nr:MULTISPECIES: DUF2975 domain-containing protein [Maribacter]MDC6388127.1 DUF2975 domain-containing protein [Maribacter sp. PR1]MEE1975515.1 DUF2975 domain-containing protein [Maribacter cobaltidurans]
MKMFGPKSISAFLFYLFRSITIGLGIFTSYVAISFGTGNFESMDGRYKMNIPLLENYIHGEHKTNVFITISIGLLFGTIFLYMLSNIFKTFKRETLFTQIAVKRMNQFALLNLLGSPFLYLIIHYIIMKHNHYRDIHNPIIHITLGLLILYGTAVFKRGFEVQSEHDLTI